MDGIFVLVVIDTLVVKMLIHANINYKKQVNPSLCPIMNYNSHCRSSIRTDKNLMTKDEKRVEKNACACDGICKWLHFLDMSGYFLEFSGGFHHIGHHHINTQLDIDLFCDICSDMSFGTFYVTYMLTLILISAGTHTLIFDLAISCDIYSGIFSDAFSSLTYWQMSGSLAWGDDTWDYLSLGWQVWELAETWKGLAFVLSEEAKRGRSGGVEEWRRTTRRRRRWHKI